jgi:hypothetical protein
MYFTSKKQAGDGYQGNNSDVSGSAFLSVFARDTTSAILLCYARLVGCIDFLFAWFGRNRCWSAIFPTLY